MDRFLGFCDGYLLVCDSNSIKYVEVADSAFKEHDNDTAKEKESAAKLNIGIQFMTQVGEQALKR